jgi:hypothetical protein
MIKMLIALAAASFALALTPAAQAGFTVPSISGKSLIVKACDDEDVVGYVAEPEDDEVYMPPQASLPQQQSQASAAPEQPAPSTPKKTADASDKTDTKADTKSDTMTETKSETKKADAKKSESKKSESKSVASADGGSCKKYFSSVGMTLSVPCE